MAQPYEFTLVSSQTAGASFTAQFATLNYPLGSIHVIYGSMSTETGLIQVSGSNDFTARTSPATAKWSSLTPTVTTLVSSCDNRLFNIPDLGYSFIQVKYYANSNTTGTISAYVVLKSYT